MHKLSGWHSNTKWTKDVDFDTGKAVKRRSSPSGASRSKGLSRARKTEKQCKTKRSSAGLDPRVVVKILNGDPQGRTELLQAARRLVQRGAEMVRDPQAQRFAALAGGVGLLLGARREVPPALVEPREDRVIPGPPYPYETAGGPLLPPPPVLGRRGAPPVAPAGHRFQSTLPPLLQDALLDSLR